ncbi:MAG: acetyl-CoA carboxylase biotin carboxylase subunit [bacterium]
MFKKMLIVNRGEISLRIIRACRELGIKTVAIFSEADRESLHVRLADESICIGPPPSSDSYLNIPSIMSAAEISNVDAIHPGYGFLSENEHFAEICQGSGLVFIGPPHDAIREMGDKAVARETMRKAGVPIVPGAKGIIEDDQQALRIADKIGYPVMIKASAGGGGKGMRIACDKQSLLSLLKMAQTEALSAFGNPEVYIEKYIEQAKHIEIQILADHHGNIIHLGERDCSVQRRHQKLIEETPSPAVNRKLREKMGKAAIKAAKAVKYTNAGTVEFLLDKKGHFYFMEMTTRIQVEHPITEMVTGIDIVKEQIRIAVGTKLKYSQKEITMNGHTIECRINAEDSTNSFAPSPGVITGYLVPGGPGVRLDSHLYKGYKIPSNYDSLVGKLIVHDVNRKFAILRMKRALSEYTIEGIKTTIPFHLKVLDTDDFQKGRVYTNFVETKIIKMEK